MQRHLWAAKFEFDIDFERENFYKFKLIYDSNFPAHRWRCKHLKYLDRIDVLIETLIEFEQGKGSREEPRILSALQNWLLLRVSISTSSLSRYLRCL